MLDEDAMLLETGVEAPIAIASSGLTLAKHFRSHLVEDKVVHAQVKKYANRKTHLKAWID